MNTSTSVVVKGDTRWSSIVAQHKGALVRAGDDQRSTVLELALLVGGRTWVSHVEPRKCVSIERTGDAFILTVVRYVDIVRKRAVVADKQLRIVERAQLVPLGLHAELDAHGRIVDASAYEVDGTTLRMEQRDQRYINECIIDIIGESLRCKYWGCKRCARHGQKSHRPKKRARAATL